MQPYERLMHAIILHFEINFGKHEYMEMPGLIHGKKLENL